MTHRHELTLASAGLARVEGEGALQVSVPGDQVEEIRLDIYEPPQFFEALLRGRWRAAGYHLPDLRRLPGPCRRPFDAIVVTTA